MCGVTEVTLTLFTVLENSVAWVGVTSYYVMGRNVSVSRCRAMAEAVSCWPITAECWVAFWAGQRETFDLYSCKFYVTLTVRVLTIILSSNTCSLWCTVYDFNTYMLRHQGVINGLPRNAFFWICWLYKDIGTGFSPSTSVYPHQRHSCSSTIHAT